MLKMWGMSTSPLAKDGRSRERLQGSCGAVSTQVRGASQGGSGTSFHQIMTAAAALRAWWR